MSETLERRIAIPRDPAPDATPALLAEGYGFIPARCRRFGSDLFEARLMMSRVVCMSGPEAAAQFYRPGRFTRRGAMPAPSFSLIQDFGSVMAMDGAAHRHRKAMFLKLLGPEAIGGLAEITAAHWRAAVEAWARRGGGVRLFHDAHLPLTTAICHWAGLHLPPRDLARLALEFEAMVEGTGPNPVRMARGHLMRARTESWARATIRAIRDGALPVPPGSAAEVVATHRDEEGRLLEEAVAAVELINLLRPTVANARFIAFAAHALHLHPQWRESLRGSDADLRPFVQEVRRFYPFIPVIGGIVIQPFDWRGHHFARGDWVLMDIHGTNRDPRSFEAPDEFRPGRFRAREPGPFEMIAQGGGAHAETHRCPGEWVTIAQMEAITRLLARGMEWEMPEQDLRIPLSRLPALPNSGVVLRGVRLTG